MPVQVTGSDALARKLDEHAARARDPRPFLVGQAADLEEILAESWADDVSPDGVPWSPRVQASRDARSGRARQRRETRPHRLLDDTGQLRASERVAVVGTSIVVTNDAPHAGFIQRGTKWMRARDIIPSAGGAGRAGAWLAAFPGRLARYIATGST